MSNKTILIVDDSRLSRMMIKSFCLASQPDWIVLEACNADEALAMCEGQKIDCMTIDYNMPGINGLELAEQLKERFPESSIAILTANIQESLITKVTALGIQFIHKPITEQKIRSYVEGM